MVMLSVSVKATKDTLKDIGPAILKGTYLEKNRTDNKGNKLPDQQQNRIQDIGGPHKSPTDAHNLGLALDIFLFNNNGEEKNTAYELLQKFRLLRTSMRWNSLKYDRQEWDGHGGYYSGQNGTHDSHIHIAWGKDKSSSSSFSQIFGKILSAPLQNYCPVGQTLPASVNPNNPVGKWEVHVGNWQWIYTFNFKGSTNYLGGVTWHDKYNHQAKGSGIWDIKNGKIVFSWNQSKTTEEWSLPLRQPMNTGTTKIASDGKTYPVHAKKIN